MTTYTSSYDSRGYRLELDVTQGTPSIPDNTTAVSYALYLRAGSMAWSHSDMDWSINIGGQVKSGRWTPTTATAFNSRIAIPNASGTVTITHDADGTKSISVSASWTIQRPSVYTPFNASASGTLPLTTIPRYATITAFSASINDRSAWLSWTTDKTISRWRWTADSGGWYSDWITVNATSGSTSVGVSPGSTYGFRIQVVNSASGLVTTSSVVSKTATKTPSTLTLNTASQNVGGNITWTVNKSYDYTHQITYTFGASSTYILGSNGVTSNTSTGTWTVPISLANQIPNATSGWGTIYLYTYYGGVHVGTNSYTFIATVPDNATFQPTATINSIVEGTTMPSDITVFVQNKSKAKVTSSGTGKYSSTIKTYSVAVAGIGTYTGSVITSAFLKNDGIVRITLTVTDSRGLKGSTYQDIDVATYSPPQLSIFNAQRSESTPEKILVNYDGSVSYVNNQNNRLFRIRSKASDGNWVVETASNDTYQLNGTRTIWSDPDKSYTIEFFIQDSFTSITQTVQVGTAFTLMNFNSSGKGMAIGKVSELDGFELGMPLYANEMRQPLKEQRTMTINNDYNYAFSVLGAIDTLSAGVDVTIEGTSGSVVFIADLKIIVNHANHIVICGVQGGYTDLGIKVGFDGFKNMDVFIKHFGVTSTDNAKVTVSPMGKSLIQFIQIYANAYSHEVTLAKGWNAFTN